MSLGPGRPGRMLMQTRREMVMWKGVEVGEMEGKSTLNTWLCWLGDGQGRGQDGEEDFQLPSGL